MFRNFWLYNIQIFPTYLGYGPYNELTVRLKKKKSGRSLKSPDKTCRNFFKIDCDGALGGLSQLSL